MDDTLGFGERDEEYKEEDWQIGYGSERFFENPTPRGSVSNQGQKIQIITQKKRLTERPLISASITEKLIFYQMYSSFFRTVVLICQSDDFNLLIWFYVFNVCFKNLPSIYVYLFLGAYAPQYHLYLSKMVPITYASNVVSIIAALLDVIKMSEVILIYIEYLMYGLILKIPWNNCSNKTITINDMSCNCYGLLEFRERIENETVLYKKDIAYTVASSNERFSMAHLLYFINRVLYRYTNEYMWILLVFTILIWLYTALFNNQIFKRHIWTVLAKSQIAFNIMCACIFIHLLVVYDRKDIKPVEAHIGAQREAIKADIFMLEEMMTSPPVTHILAARSIGTTRPGIDSTIIVLSNALLYLFRNLNILLLQIYSENLVKVPILGIGKVSVLPAFTAFPIYFATVPWGDFLVLLFFMLISVGELCFILLICQFIIETIVCEWRLRPWFASFMCLLISVGFLAFKRFGWASIRIMKFCVNSTCVILETIALYCMYPLGRLADDIMFHHGTAPSRLRILSFRVAPVYILFKLYMTFYYFINRNIKKQEFINGYIGSCISYVCGAIYMIYKYVYKQRKSWEDLFKPVPKWGPPEFATRQLRKQFDSREYIVSEAPRELSRHLIAKVQSKVYKVDINYDNFYRRTTRTMKTDPFAVDNTKKVI